MVPKRRKYFIIPPTAVPELDHITTGGIELRNDVAQSSSSEGIAWKQLKEKAAHALPQDISNVTKILDEGFGSLKSLDVGDQLANLDRVDKLPATRLADPGLNRLDRRPGIKGGVQLHCSVTGRVMRKPRRSWQIRRIEDIFPVPIKPTGATNEVSGGWSRQKRNNGRLRMGPIPNHSGLVELNRATEIRRTLLGAFLFSLESAFFLGKDRAIRHDAQWQARFTRLRRRLKMPHHENDNDGADKGQEKAGGMEKGSVGWFGKNSRNQSSHHRTNNSDESSEPESHGLIARDKSTSYEPNDETNKNGRDDMEHILRSSD
jgi:hypothetical protein